MKLGIVLLSLGTLAAVVACSSEDESSGGAAGSGGSAGISGAAGAPSGGGTAGGGATGGSAGLDGGGAAGSDSGGAAGQGGMAGGGGADAGVPSKLSETGLYADITKGTLATGVAEYQPQWPLWSDGATKKRWVYLPPGAKIDTSDMDYWVYPVGIKLWKEFVRDGKRVETRLLEKRGPSDWLMLAFQWNDAQTEALAVPAGVQNASGTQHDIPSQNDCAMCHDKMKDRALSFSALQLSHQQPGLTLSDLISTGRLTHPPSGGFTLPGSATDRAALGYLHANCGVCHNPTSFMFAIVNMQLWLETDQLGSVAATPTYLTTVNQTPTASNPTGSPARITPGDPSKSDVHLRMSERGTLTQMPPLGTELTDATGLGAVDAWINSL